MKEISAHDFCREVPCAAQGCKEMTDVEHSLCLGCRNGTSDAAEMQKALAAADGPLPLPGRRRRLVEHPALTKRMLEVLLAIADGDTDAEIAAALFLSVSTVKSHIKHLLAALDARNRAHAVALGYHQGLLVPKARA